MPKPGEIAYWRNITEDERRHAVNKPFADDHCEALLEDIAAIMRLLPPPPARVLDLGCGTGWTSVFLARRGHTVTGVDIAADMIAAGEATRVKDGLSNLTFLVADYESLRLPEPVDAVVFFDALHHAEDPALALRCAFDALRPGGVCVTHEPGVGHADTEASRRAVEELGVTENEMPPARIIELGREIGFGRFHAFPLPAEARIVEYRLDEGTRIDDASGMSDPRPKTLRGAGRLKRLFHDLVRTRLRFTPPSYAGFIDHLPQVQRAAERLDWSVLSRIGAITVLVK